MRRRRRPSLATCRTPRTAARSPHPPRTHHQQTDKPQHPTLLEQPGRERRGGAGAATRANRRPERPSCSSCANPWQEDGGGGDGEQRAPHSTRTLVIVRQIGVSGALRLGRRPMVVRDRPHRESVLLPIRLSACGERLHLCRSGRFEPRSTSWRPYWREWSARRQSPVRLAGRNRRARVPAAQLRRRRDTSAGPRFART